MTSLESIKKKLYVKNEYGVEYQNPAAVLDEPDVDWLEKQFGIRTDWHRSCINCQARQLIKYAGRKDSDGVPIKEFRVKCKGIASQLPPDSYNAIKKMVDDGIPRKRAMQLIQSTIDPVAWASLMFGFNDSDITWNLRNYQKEQLRCTSQRLVIREGRRSGKTFIIALKLIVLAMTREVRKGTDLKTGKPIITGPEIMVVTPFQSQLLNIFDEMEKLVKRNGDLMKRVTTASGGGMYVKTPYFHMDFDNGAVINGFVSGVATKTDGSGGGTMRGRNANIIYLDEMDMIPEDTLNKVVLPILLTDLLGEVMLIATSTPIGKRAKFYEWCLNSPEFKEDHLPSTVLPQWEENKKIYEQEGNEESFRSEYMAEFIDAAYGVFKPGLIYDCMRDYKYHQTQSAGWYRDGAGVLDPKKLITCIGIDWNKNAGTEYVVVQYDPGSNKFMVVDVVNVSASQFSSVRWKEEVIRLNYKWKPDYIYADEGYGHTIIEDLKVLSHEFAAKPQHTLRDVETSKIKDRLKAFNFSSKVELRSPIDGKVINKAGKEFLVENAVRVLEDRKLWFPESEEQLRKEMLNYVVLRRSPTTNKPVYGAENEQIGDHRLDALMLGLGGLVLENGMYSQRAIPASAPGMFTREFLDERASTTGGDPNSAKNVLERLQKAGAHGDLTFMQINRESPVRTPAQPPARVAPRSRGRMGESTEESVFEYFNSKASDYRGYADDTEYKYQEQEPSSHAIGRRKRSRTRSIRRRRR